MHQQHLSIYRSRILISAFEPAQLPDLPPIKDHRQTVPCEPRGVLLPFQDIATTIDDDQTTTPTANDEQMFNTVLASKAKAKFQISNSVPEVPRCSLAEERSTQSGRRMPNSRSEYGHSNLEIGVIPRLKATIRSHPRVDHSR
ncbi:hypothetical protein Hypma_003974 [Hypsizygus marmoreus]|uniref:Uncharacterized protein n=1 Tax=Hypsizygus marmoreus TaxID=39966 RepID=A0A369J3G8_HYPMA|nr:hypothetical protein Hypma_003974 [Hypsizygus marmoreus]